jgi:predicted nucleotidyltransferase
MVERRLTAMVRALYDAGVEFLVVGGVAAVLNGAPVNTFDVDVVHRRTTENVERLMPVLEEMDAVYRIQPERRLRPAKPALLSAGHQNLITKYGPLDLLGSIGRDMSYVDLLPHSTEMVIAEGIRVYILNLETLIELKEQLGGEKDRAMLPILRGVLERKGR